MGQVSLFLRRSNVVLDRLANAFTATSRSFFERGLDVGRRSLKTRLRRLRGRLGGLLRRPRLLAKPRAISR